MPASLFPAAQWVKICFFHRPKTMSESYTPLASLKELMISRLMCIHRDDGPNILLAYAGGTVYATDDTCTHEDASLAKGSLQGACVKCPLHGSRFDLGTGAALDDPAEEPLRTYPVKLDGDDILVDLQKG
jgi:3-phenylpropionate/trans-cinnamate dioxygenase ferredoxin subunit